MINDDITNDQLKIIVHHIGGIGKCGPTESLAVFGKDVKWIIYDADKDSLSACDEFSDRDYSLVNKCIGGVNSKGVFNIAFTPSASSVLLPSPKASHYTYFARDGDIRIWGEHAHIVRSANIEINTLDWLKVNKKLPPVDFLSIDAQGTELDIINGASKMIKSSTIGVVCEVEFAELYKGQALFCDIQSRLLKDGFRFCEIYANQYHNTFPYAIELQGNGFYTVGEALFLKEPDFQKKDTQNVIRCIKLAAIAVAFDQLDFSLNILRKLREKKLVSLEKLAENTQINYIKLLRDLLQVADVVEAEKSNPASSPTNKMALFTKFVIARGKRTFAKKLGNKNVNNYHSRVSKIFHAYELYDLAEKHDARFVKNLLSPLSRVMKYFFCVLS